MKLAEYQAAGIPEYWLIDQRRRCADFNQLGPDSRYHLGVTRPDGTYESPTLAGMRPPVEWLWSDPPSH